MWKSDFGPFFVLFLFYCFWNFAINFGGYVLEWYHILLYRTALMEVRPSQNQPATARSESLRCTTVTATPLPCLGRHNISTDQVRGAGFTTKKKEKKRRDYDPSQITSVTTTLLFHCALPPSPMLPPPPPVKSLKSRINVFCVFMLSQKRRQPHFLFKSTLSLPGWR